MRSPKKNLLSKRTCEKISGVCRKKGLTENIRVEDYDGHSDPLKRPYFYVSPSLVVGRLLKDDRWYTILDMGLETFFELACRWLAMKGSGKR